MNPVFLPGVTVPFISAMNTQWHHFLEILERRESHLPAHCFCIQRLLLKFPPLPLISHGAHPVFSGSEVGKSPSFHTISGSVFSDNCAVSSEDGHLFTLADVSVSLPVSFLGWLLYQYHLILVGASLLSGQGDGFTSSFRPSGDFKHHPDRVDIIHLLSISAGNPFLIRYML